MYVICGYTTISLNWYSLTVFRMNQSPLNRNVKSHQACRRATGFSLARGEPGKRAGWTPKSQQLAPSSSRELSACRKQPQGGGADGCEAPRPDRGAVFHSASSSTSSTSTGMPRGRLTTPRTIRPDSISVPKTLRRSSDAPSATFG